MKEARAKAVLTRVAEMADWGGTAPDGRACGVAMHKSFGTYVAQIAEVSEGADGLPKVHKVWVRGRLRRRGQSQRHPRADGGRDRLWPRPCALCANSCWARAAWSRRAISTPIARLRIGEMPEVEVAIITSGESPTGVGEPGLPPLAPAVANAWRKLTGKAVRRLALRAWRQCMIGARVVALAVAVARAADRGARRERRAGRSDARPPLPASPTRTRARSRCSSEMGKVIESPRCINCHPRSDRPLQGDDMHPHSPPVVRGPYNFGASGMECTTCHGRDNVPSPMARAASRATANGASRRSSMAWEGKSLGEICAQIKDPARNGHKTLEQLVEHNTT